MISYQLLPVGNPPKDTCCLLVDNGSLRPAATLGLRMLAAGLSARLEREVEPVSLLHSSAVPAEDLGGCPAEILEPALRVRHAAGIREFLIVPLFFGPSSALTDYIPERVAGLGRDLPGLRVRMAPPVCGAGEGPDLRIARILADHARYAAARVKVPQPRLVLVDHGSPQRGVATLRDRVAQQLAAELRRDSRSVRAASMERRDGPGFAFNDPLLERALDEAAMSGGAGAREVVVAPLFFLPGRHAGPGGDIEAICRAAEHRHPGLRVHITELVGEHPMLLDVLVDRCREGLAGSPLPNS